jgi:hypothetical protein
VACMAHTRTTESQKPVPRVDGMTSLLGSIGDKGSRADADPVGYLFQRGVEPAFGEDGASGIEDPQTITFSVRPQRAV